MAVWQFDVTLIPHAEVATIDPPPFAVIPLEWLSEAERDKEWWASHQPVDGFLTALDGIAPRSRSWAADILWWGTEDGNRIDVGYSGKRVSEIRVRFDLRAPDEVFITTIAGLAQDLHCDFLGRDGSLVEGDATNLAILLRKSSSGIT